MNPPKYVKMGTSEHASCLRLRGDMYWVDAGEWGFNFAQTNARYEPITFTKSEFVSVSKMSHLNNQPLYECSEAEWLKKNKGYMSKDYILENGKTLGDNQCDEMPLSDYVDVLITRDDNGEYNTEIKNNMMYLLIRHDVSVI